MNADVLIWGPIGGMYSLGKLGTKQLRQYKWRDLPDSELEDAINWVMNTAIREHSPYEFHPDDVHVHIYSETMYMPAGQIVQIGKNRAGGGTMFHYMIVSDQKIESQEQGEALVWEALKPDDAVANDPT